MYGNVGALDTDINGKRKWKDIQLTCRGSRISHLLFVNIPFGEATEKQAKIMEAI